MTSISQPVIPPQVSSNASSTVAPAHSPSTSSAGRAPPPAAGTAPAKASQANATKKPFSPPPASSGSTPPVVGSAQQNKHDRSSPVNGKVAIPPAVPAVGNPALANGNTPTSSTSGRGDHLRKPSVTISAAGAPQNGPNGASAVGKSPGGPPIVFGSLNADGSPRSTNATPHQPAQTGTSLGVNNPANPRVVSPANSPSPIPQPSASGGKPPTHGHAGSVNFGQFSGPDPNMRFGVASGPLAPGAQHLRRESSQSQHSDISNHGMGPGAGRGGYPPQGGRGRGYGPGPQYQQQMPYSPQPGFRQQAPPNQPGARPGMPFQQQQRGSFGPGPYPNSPHQAARSPVPPHAQPAHPGQPGPMPMPSPQMGQNPYNGYPNQYGAYNNMPPQQVAPNFHSAESWRNTRAPPHGPPNGPPGRFKKGNSMPFPKENRPSIPYFPKPQHQPVIDISPASGNFEHLLTLSKQAYAMNNGYNGDPAYAYQYSHYFNQGFGPQYGAPQMPPQSPRPPNQMPPGPGQQGPYGAQYAGAQPPAMSRTSSAISGADRPNSSMGKPAPASSTPAPPNNVAAANRPAASPAPKATNNFQIPQKKSAGIVIRNPNSGDIVDLKKPSLSPAPSSKSPAPASSTAPTPPPRAPSHDSAHVRNESKSVKTDEEKRAEMKEAIAKKQAADKAEEQRKKDESEAADDKKEADSKKEKEDDDAKEAAQAKAAEDAEKAKADAEEASKAKETATSDEDAAAEKARKDQELEDEIARWEAEAAEKEREEEEREKAYAAKKAAEKEEAVRKEAEIFQMKDEEMKKAEREMEAAEDKRLKGLDGGAGEDSQQERDDLFAALKKDEGSTPTSETPAAVETPESSGVATPASEVSSMAPPKSAGKQKPAALKLETTKSVEPPQPTPQLVSLRSARPLTHINTVAYPAAINSPNPALNASAKGNSYKYERAFLMQFQRAFTEKPSEDWNQRVKETVGDTTEPSSARAASARSGGPGGSMGMSGRQTSNRAPLPQMGAFASGGRTLPPGTTSQARFEAANRAGPTAARPTMNNPLASFVSRPGGAFPQPGAVKMDRGPSSSGMGHPNSPRNASRGGSSQRGNRQNTRREDPKDNKAMPLTAGANLKPIEVTATGWKPRSVGAAANMSGPAPGGDGLMAPDVVQRKVKSNLNKMTPNNFDKISAQILAIAHQSKDETDGRSLRQVIQLTFEKATDEAHWAEMYAQFCKRMLESMSSEIKDESILDKKGDVVAGGALFRKYLLTRCQTEFEQGWKMNLPDKPEGETKEAVLLSDEYYIAAAAKRRGLGLVRFIGELYKLGMLTERIMHECVKKLVDYESTPDEAEVESLTSLLKTIGGQLDSSEKGHQMMDVYFERIKRMVDLPDLPSRLRFMLMDTVDLRRSGWQSKGTGVKGPTTLDAVRQQAVEADRQKEAQRAADSSRGRGGGGGGRPGLGRGDARGFQGGGPQFGMPPPDYHKTVGMDDLRRLGSKGGNRQASSQGPTFGPTSMFNSARGSNSRKPINLAKNDDSGASSRVSTPPGQKEKEKKEEQEAKKSANTFSALASLENAEAADGGPSPAASPPTTNAQLASIADRARSKSPLGKDPEASKDDAETS